jgi:hypothetical protein
MQLACSRCSPIRISCGEYARIRLTRELASSVNFIAGTIPPVREIVIVIADLYLPPTSTEVGEASHGSTAQPSGSASDANAPDGMAGPSPGPLGLEHLARFGQRRTLDAEGGWRAWLARRLGREDLVNVPPAVIATAAFDQWPPPAAIEAVPSAAPSAPVEAALSAAPSARIEAVPSAAPSAPIEAVPSAAPSVRIEAALSAAPSAPIEAALSAAPSAPIEAALSAAPSALIEAVPSAAPSARIEGATARAPGASSTVWLATPLHRIAGLTTLHLDRRSILHFTAAEAEGFALDFNRTFGNDPTLPLRLHDFPGGSLLLEAPANVMAMTTEPARALVRGLQDSMPQGSQATAFKRLSAEVEMWLYDHPLNTFRIKRGDRPVNAFWFWGGGPIDGRPQRSPPNARASLRLFGIDPYLAGLAGLTGGPFLNGLPKIFPDVANTQRTVFLTQLNPLLHTHPTGSVFDAVAEIDRRFIAPALAALHAGAVESLTLVANDIELTVRRHDRLKFWRRSKPTLMGLR